MAQDGTCHEFTTQRHVSCVIPDSVGSSSFALWLDPQDFFHSVIGSSGVNSWWSNHRTNFLFYLKNSIIIHIVSYSPPVVLHHFSKDVSRDCTCTVRPVVKWIQCSVSTTCTFIVLLAKRKDCLFSRRLKIFCSDTSVKVIHWIHDLVFVVLT
jgi:hypothetical protein